MNKAAQIQSSRFTDTRMQILETARSIILGKGFAAVGLNEILKTAQVPKGSFYHYFKSKEDFGNALLEYYFDHYLAQLNKALAADGRTASKRMLDYFSNWMDTQCSDTSRDKCLVVKLSGEVADLSETMRQTLKKGTERVIDRLAQCIQEGIDAKEFVINTDAQTVTKEIYYLWIGATLLTKVHHTPDALQTAMKATTAKLNISAEKAA